MFEQIPAEPVVVFVDDEEEILEILRDIFSEAPYRVHCFARGKDAMRYAEDQEVLAVVCDLYLKDVSGAEVLKHYQRVSPDTYRVLMTGYFDEEQEEQAKREELFHQLIPKPWDIYGLRKEIDRIVTERSRRAEVR